MPRFDWSEALAHSVRAEQLASDFYMLAGELAELAALTDCLNFVPNGTSTTSLWVIINIPLQKMH